MAHDRRRLPSTFLRWTPQRSNYSSRWAEAFWPRCSVASLSRSRPCVWLGSAARETLRAQREAAVKQLAAAMQDHIIAHRQRRAADVDLDDSYSSVTSRLRFRFGAAVVPEVGVNSDWLIAVDRETETRNLVARSRWEADFRLEPGSPLAQHVDDLFEAFNALFTYRAPNRIDPETKALWDDFEKVLADLPRLAAAELKGK